MSRKVSTDKNLPVDDLLSRIEKESSKAFKEHTPTRLSEYRKDIPRLWYSTGIPTLDISLAGGLAGGRVSEWFGPPNSGKSTLLYSAIAENQQEYYFLKQQQQKALKERDYFKTWGTTKY